MFSQNQGGIPVAPNNADEVTSELMNVANKSNAQLKPYQEIDIPIAINERMKAVRLQLAGYQPQLGKLKEALNDSEIQKNIKAIGVLR